MTFTENNFVAHSACREKIVAHTAQKRKDHRFLQVFWQRSCEHLASFSIPMRIPSRISVDCKSVHFGIILDPEWNFPVVAHMAVQH